MRASPSPRVDADALAAAFAHRTGSRPRIARAPGRINVIGEHTDYNDGWVLPAAIDRAAYVAFAPSDDGAFTLIADDLDARVAVAPEALDQAPAWARFALGPAIILRTMGIAPPGAILQVRGDVPMGMGMSSSAALMAASAMAFAALAGARLSPMDIARVAQRAEREIVGVPCGLMDQFASTHGQAGCALLLDCRTLTWRAAPAPPDARFVVFESGVRHALTDGGYAQRRAECERAAAALGAASLRDVEAADLAPLERTDPIAFRRARHVLSENARTLQAVIALERGDLAQLGALMDASHASLRDDFAVTCPETDALAARARAAPGVFGARQMGGGFGGGVLALVETASAEQIAADIADATGQPSLVCTLAKGAEILA